MTWWKGRMLALDVETTGPLPEQARIVQYGLAWVGGGEQPSRHAAIVNPGVPIPAEATAVHGITDEMAADGMPHDAAVDFIVENIATAAARRVPVVAFNARYDLTVIDRAARAEAIDMGGLLWDAVRVVDPMVIDKLLDKYRRSYPDAPRGMNPEQAQAAGHISTRTLEGMCRHFGVRLDQAHDASADAVAAARLAYKFGQSGRVIRQRPDAEGAEAEQMWEAARGDLDELHAMQVLIANADRVRFAAYKRGELDKLISADAPAEQVATVRAMCERVELERGWPVLEVMPHELPEWDEGRTSGVIA